jgi:hypothetical protein
LVEQDGGADTDAWPRTHDTDIREHTFFFVDFNLAYGSSGIELPIPVEIAVLAFSFGTHKLLLLLVLRVVAISLSLTHTHDR